MRQSIVSTCVWMMTAIAWGGCAEDAQDDLPMADGPIEDVGVDADRPQAFDHDGAADGASAPLVEGSPLADSVLRLVNDAMQTELTDAHGLRLAPRVASAIVSHRAGADGRLGTIDDDPFNSLAELDAVAYVGPAVMKRLQTSAAQSPQLDMACEARDARPFPLEPIVAPGDGEARVVALLTSAKRTIDITIYQFTSEPILAALAAATSRGVQVRVILDRQQDENAALVTRLRGLGAQAILSSSAFVYTHQKTIVVDGELVVVFSGNLETRGFARSRNYGAIDRDFEDVRDFAALFEADWAGGSATFALDCTRIVYSPVNSRRRVLDVISGSVRSLEMEAMYLTDYQVREALRAAAGRGVTVRVLLNDPRFGNTSSGSAVRRLVSSGIEVRRLPSMFIHAKILIADGSTFFVGSENYSDNSLDRNREAGLVLGASDIDLTAIRAVWDGDWTNAVAF